MNYFFSTLNCAEFKKPLFGKERFTVDVLTLTVVNEKGNVYSALNKQFNPSEVEEFTLNKILNSFTDKSHLTQKASKSNSLVGKINILQDLAGRTRFEMWQGLSTFMQGRGIVYGYQPFTDFTILKTLVNINLFSLRDLKQLESEISEDFVGGDYGVSEDSEYPVLEKELGAMTSYEKAHWYKKLYEFLINFKARYNHVNA